VLEKKDSNESEEDDDDDDDDDGSFDASKYDLIGDLDEKEPSKKSKLNR
jgi:hypothetical protein